MDKYHDIIRDVARDNGMTYGELYGEILQIIQALKDSPDPKRQSEFEKIPREGEIPTPEEFLDHIIKKMIARGYTP